ncbi:MAG: 50S ribosomal protein L10 [Candidatus Vogelbacteria bacterium]|nr:50S ribosomal protein L10 [Candidatus Vogelbacteria bacterium]
MAISKQKKAETLDVLKTEIKGAESVVFVNFHGLKVPDTVALRRALRAKGIGYHVAKKTLIKLALKDAGITGDLPELAGEIAIAYGNDTIMPVKEITEFRKKHKENIAVVGGILEGAYLSPLQMADLAKTPSREVLLGKLVNVMYSPVQGFVATMNAVPASFVRTLDAIAKSKA